MTPKTKALLVSASILATAYFSGDSFAQSYGRCQTHSQCDDQSICISEHCVFAYGRDYSITIGGANGIPQRNPSRRSTWDALGGMPDPLLMVTIDGQQFQTHPIANTLRPVWSYTIPRVRINQTTRFQWRLMDFDNASGADYMIGSAPHGISVQNIKNGRWIERIDGIAVDFTIRPL